MFLHLFIFFFIYIQFFINKTSGIISEEDEKWLSSVILDSPERAQNPIQPKPIHTNPSIVQSASTTKKRKKSNKITEESLERRRLLARIYKKRKKEESVESLETFKAKQKEYRRKYLSKIRNNPTKIEKFKESQRIATQKSYVKKKKQDPEGFTEYLRKKNQRARNKKKLQKKTEDIN